MCYNGLGLVLNYVVFMLLINSSWPELATHSPVLVSVVCFVCVCVCRHVQSVLSCLANSRLALVVFLFFCIAMTPTAGIITSPSGSSIPFHTIMSTLHVSSRVHLRSVNQYCASACPILNRGKLTLLLSQSLCVSVPVGVFEWWCWG